MKHFYCHFENALQPHILKDTFGIIQYTYVYPQISWKTHSDRVSVSFSILCNIRSHKNLPRVLNSSKEKPHQPVQTLANSTQTGGFVGDYFHLRRRKHININNTKPRTVVINLYFPLKTFAFLDSPTVHEVWQAKDWNRTLVIAIINSYKKLDSLQLTVRLSLLLPHLLWLLIYLYSFPVIDKCQAKCGLSHTIVGRVACR